jgi:CBS domain containing-hemolysin-like protein
VSAAVAAGLALAGLASAFFSLAEVAVLSSSRLGLRRWVRRSLEGEEWMGAADVVEHPHRLLTPILAGRAMAWVTAAALGARLAIERGESPLATAAWTALLLALCLYFLEVVVGAVARAKGDRLLPTVSVALRASAWVFRPFVAVAQAVTSPLVGSGAAGAGRRALDDLLDESERVGLLEAPEREIIAGVFEFGRTSAAAVMRPLEHAVTAPAGSAARDIAELVQRTGQTRIPIHGRDERRIVGMVHLFDLFHLGPDERPHPRRVVAVPPGTPCDDLLVEMRRRKTHLAVVTQDGAALGVVAMEDLVQVLIGEIRRQQPGHGRR